MEGTWVIRNLKCTLINVYASHDARKKQDLWAYLILIMANNKGSFIVIGDFNVVWSASERLGSGFSSSPASDFNNFIFEAALVDIPMDGRKFTRMDRFGCKLSRLDRFLISEGLLDDVPNLCCFALERRWSDHCLLILKEDPIGYGPSFKMFNSWLDMDGFSEVVSNCR